MGPLLSIVSYLMSDEVGTLNKTFSTLITLKGPVALLSVFILTQRRVRAEGFCPFVLCQSGCLLKDQPLLALIRLLSSMLPLMLGQGGAVPEALSTVVTLIRPLLSMSTQV